MSDHLLFLVGVVGSDDDRPRQHRPQPVRCLEDELAPMRDNRRRCADCGLLSPSARPELCASCMRERQLAKKNAVLKKRYTDHAAEQSMLERIRERGWSYVANNNRHIVDRLVAAGKLRLMTVEEQRAAGLQRFDAVAVFRSQP